MNETKLDTKPERSKLRNKLFTNNLVDRGLAIE